MADVGSVKYKVELDNSGLDKDTQNTEKTISSKLDAISGKISRSFGYQVLKDIGGAFLNLGKQAVQGFTEISILCGNGFAANYVTGMAPSITLSGRRIFGDDAQDYIFGKKYALMGDRDTHFRLSRTNEAGTETAMVSANVTLCNITDLSGAANDASACSVEIRFNGAPFLGDAWAT